MRFQRFFFPCQPLPDPNPTRCARASTRLRFLSAHSLSLHPFPSPPVARIALVKPDKARSVEDLVLGMARRGQLQEKVRGTRESKRSGERARFFLRLLLPFLSFFSSTLLTTQVSEDHLVRLLEQMGAAGGGGGRTKVTIQRRRGAFDDDD